MTFTQHALLVGRYKPEDIAVAVDSTTEPRYPAELLEEIEASWQAQLQDAERKGYNLWDSPCYRLNEVESDNGRAELGLGLIDFRIVRGLIPLVDAGDLPVEYASRQMYSSLIVRTNDGKFIFGTGAEQHYVGELKFVGGVYSRVEYEITDGRSLFQAALNELEEELNVPRYMVGSMYLRAIYATPRGLRDLCFEVELGISSNEVRKLFAVRKDKELADILVLDKVQAHDAVSGLRDRRCEKAALID